MRLARAIAAGDDFTLTVGPGRRLDIMSVGPGLAKEWLDRLEAAEKTEGAPINRKVDWGHVQRLQEEIDAGHWQAFYALFHLTDDGILINGQQRAWAIYRSGKTVPCLVVAGAQREDINGIDLECKPRNVAQQARIMRRLPNAEKIVAGIRAISFIRGGSARGLPPTLSPSATNQLIDEWAAYVQDALEMLRRQRRGKRHIGNAMVYGTFGYFLKRPDLRDGIEDFVEQAIEYKDRKVAGPAAALDRTLQSLGKEDDPDPDARSPMQRRMCLTLAALRHHFTGTPCARLLRVNDRTGLIAWARKTVEGDAEMRAVTAEGPRGL